jgi:pilus assembly protein CpaF
MTGKRRAATLPVATTPPAQRPAATRPVQLAPASAASRSGSGAGPLTHLLDAPDVTDVLVNGTEVWVDRGGGLRRVAVDVGTLSDVRRLAQRLAAAAGRRLDDAAPWVDAQLADGTRLHAVLPPVARGGPYLSLRTFRGRALSLDELVAGGGVDPGAAEVLAAMVAARLPYVISGGTGSGKTTVLSALVSEVPFDERIVIVEDAAELRPAHPHCVLLQARTSNVEGAGAVSLRDLVRQALRMRPDRLVVGECRGAEVVDLLGALNTGHEGGAATLHANTPMDVPARLEALGLLSGVPRAALHALVVAALRVVVHLRRERDGARVLTEIGVLATEPGDRRILVIPAWLRSATPARGPASFPSREHAPPLPAGHDPVECPAHDPGPSSAAPRRSYHPGPGPGALHLARLLTESGVTPPEVLR